MISPQVIQVAVSVTKAAREPRPIFFHEDLEVCAAVNPKPTVIHVVITRNMSKKHLKKKPISMFGQLFEHLIVENGYKAIYVLPTFWTSHSWKWLKCAVDPMM